MKQIITKDRQTLFDIALQYCGDANAAFQIAEDNDISLSAVPEVGTALNVPDPDSVVAKKIVEYYALNNVSPATDDSMPNETFITSIAGIQIVTIKTREEIITII
jgi:hypothetical protein